MGKLITVLSSLSSTECSLAQSYLESRGIISFIKGTNNLYVPNLAVPAELQVCQQDMEIAVHCLIEGGYLKQENLEPSSEIKFVNKVLNFFRK